MANQGADRRTVLEMLAKAAAASQFPGFRRWVFGQQPAREPRKGTYRPAFFSPSEYHTIDVLTGLIIPADGTPGAREAGVSEFIDFLAAHGETDIQEPMRRGLQWLDAVSRKRHGAPFASLSPEQQDGVLRTAAHRGQAPRDDPQGQAFFRLIRRYTVMGYYTSRIGLEELDYPGLRIYSASPACPHTGDPEHRHLPPPKV